MATTGGKDELTFVSFLVRVVLSTALVLATYNPTEYCFANWFWDAWNAGTLSPPHWVALVVVVIGWVILVSATFNAIGPLGLALGAALLATLVWWLMDLGVLQGTGVGFFTWVVLVCLGILLAIGFSWAHIWRKMTGQVDVHEGGR